MRTIAIDALGIAPSGGGRTATLNVLREVLRLDVDSRYLLLLNHPEPELEVLGPHVEQVLIPMRHPWGARLWAQGTWPLALRRRGVDLVHHMKNLTALGLPGPTVVTIYDLTTVLHPAFYTRADVAYWRHVQPRLLRRAEAVVAISERTAEDLPVIGLMTSPGKVVYVRNNFKNVPRLAMAGWIAHEPGNTCPESYFFAKER